MTTRCWSVSTQRASFSQAAVTLSSGCFTPLRLGRTRWEPVSLISPQNRWLSGTNKIKGKGLFWPEYLEWLSSNCGGFPVIGCFNGNQVLMIGGFPMTSGFDDKLLSRLKFQVTYWKLHRFKLNIAMILIRSLSNLRLLLDLLYCLLRLLQQRITHVFDSGGRAHPHQKRRLSVDHVHRSRIRQETAWGDNAHADRTLRHSSSRQAGKITISHSINQSIGPSIDQLITQSIDRSITQSIDQSNGLMIYHYQAVTVPGQKVTLSQERIALGNLPLFSKMRKVVFMTNTSQHVVSFSWHVTNAVDQRVSKLTELNYYYIIIYYHYYDYYYCVSPI